MGMRWNHSTILICICPPLNYTLDLFHVVLSSYNSLGCQPPTPTHYMSMNYTAMSGVERSRERNTETDTAGRVDAVLVSLRPAVTSTAALFSLRPAVTSTPLPVKHHIMLLYI